MQSKNPYRDGRALQRCGALFTWRAHLTHCLRCPCCPAAEIAAKTAVETAAGNRKEMFLEGDRFFEMKRNGTPEFWTAYNGRKYTTESFMYTFPIPVNDILIVDGLKQNPGYDELQSN